jgi:molybdopterin synthase catalytic subunit
VPDFLLSTDPIPVTETPPFAPGEGAEVRFLGTVRGMEDGRPISGIDYSAYLPMAEKMLGALVEQGRLEHGPHEVFIQHRLGFVAAEHPSIVIGVRPRHSAEAFELCHWYLKQVKTRVPVWKRPVFMEAGGNITLAL